MNHAHGFSTIIGMNTIIMSTAIMPMSRAGMGMEAFPGAGVADWLTTIPDIMVASSLIPIYAG